MIFYHIQNTGEEAQKKEFKVNMDDKTGLYMQERIPNPVSFQEIQRRIKNEIDQVNESLLKETQNNEKLLNS